MILGKLVVWVCAHAVRSVLAFALVGGSASALAGVLERIAAGGPLVLAHRESSVPFSYVNEAGQAIGYAVDLCLKLAQAVRVHTKRADMPVKFLMVTPADRITAIAQGRADLECGSTTNNAQRRQSVAFTVPHFITGARLLVRSDSKIRGLEDLKGAKLVSTRGTTPLKIAQQINSEHLMRIQVLEVADHAQAVSMVEKGDADAFVMDDVLLYGLIANRPNPAALKVVGRYLSTEPLAIMLPKDDPAFKTLVDQEMRRLIVSREIFALYDKWFMQPIAPRAVVLNMPVSHLLRDFWKYPSDWVPF